MTLRHLLEGRPFGHPLHTMIVHAPLGLWFMGLIFDCIAVYAPADRWAVEGAYWMILLGTVMGVLATVTGFVDWLVLRADRPGQKEALWHMAAMLPAMALFTIDTVLHYTAMKQGRPPYFGLGLSIAGNLLTLIGGYLGGIMIYDDGISVGRHRRITELPQRTIHEPKAGTTETPLPPSAGLGPEYHPVVPELALEQAGTLRVEINGVVITLVRGDGRIYAVQDFCTHRCGPLSEGAVCDGHIECPWHRSVFDLATGKPVKGPAKVDLKTYEVRVQGGIIHVCIDRPGKLARSEGGGERRNPEELKGHPRDRDNGGRRMPAEKSR